jgi:hypothetical protein
MKNGLEENLHYLIYAHGVVWLRLMCQEKRSINWDPKLWIAYLFGICSS